MQDHQIALLQTSFSEVYAVKDDAAALFYERLFVLDPSLRVLFANTDIRTQGTKLMAALSTVINNLTRLDTVLPHLDAMAQRHAGYGVEEQHYDTVGTALIQTFGLFFGERFTPELRDAWTVAYGTVAGRMIESSRTQALAS